MKTKIKYEILDNFKNNLFDVKKKKKYVNAKLYFKNIFF